LLKTVARFIRAFLNPACDSLDTEAKKQGRNTWSWYQEKYNDLPKIDYINLRLDLSEALEKAQLNVFYQPLVQPKQVKLLP
jgi:hypothetical protein